MQHRRWTTARLARQWLALVGMALTLALAQVVDEERHALQTLHQAWRTAHTIEDLRERAQALHQVAQAFARLKWLEEARAAFYEALMIALSEGEVFAQGELLKVLLTSSIIPKICPDADPNTNRRGGIVRSLNPIEVKELPFPVLAAAAAAARESLQRAPIEADDVCALLAQFRTPDWYIQGAISSDSLSAYRVPILLKAAQARLYQGDFEAARGLLKRAFYEKSRLQPLPSPSQSLDTWHEELLAAQIREGFYYDAYLTTIWRLNYYDITEYYDFLIWALLQNNQLDVAYQTALSVPEPPLRGALLYLLVQKMVPGHPFDRQFQGAP